MYESDTEIIDNVTKILMVGKDFADNDFIIADTEKQKNNISKSHIYVGIIGIIICICLITAYFILYRPKYNAEDDIIKDIKVHRDYFKAVKQKEKNKKIIFADLPKINLNLSDNIPVDEKQIIIAETPKTTEFTKPSEDIKFKINNKSLHSADDY